MTLYEGQRRESDTTLLTGERAGLIFTEQDRRHAYRATERAKEESSMDFRVLSRLNLLSSSGHSVQADYLFKQLAQANPELLSIEHVDDYIQNHAARDRSGLVIGIDNLIGSIDRARALTN